MKLTKDTSSTANLLPTEPDPSRTLGIKSGSEPPLPPTKENLHSRRVLGGLLAILIAGGITFIIVWLGPQIQRFQHYGYPGIFLISLISNASIALPIPSLAITFAMGAVLNWIFVGLVAGIGEALGESTGYLAGLGGSAIIENQRIYQRMKYYMEHHGMLTVFILSAVPNPIIDLAGIAAGASRYGYHKFLFACWIGKTIKTLIFAWAGAHSITWMLQFL